MTHSLKTVDNGTEGKSEANDPDYKQVKNEMQKKCKEIGAMPWLVQRNRRREEKLHISAI